MGVTILSDTGLHMLKHMLVMAYVYKKMQNIYHTMESYCKKK